MKSKFSYQQVYYHINKVFEYADKSDVVNLAKHSGKLKDYANKSPVCKGYHLLSVGILNIINSEKSIAHDFLLEANKQFIESGSKSAIGISLLYLANCFDSDQGVIYAKKGAEIFSSLGDEIGLYRVLTTCAAILSKLGNNNEAEKLIRKLISVNNVTDHLAFIINLDNLNALYLEIGNYQSALYYGQQAVELLLGILHNPEKQYAYVWQTTGWIKVPARCDIYLANAYTNYGNVLKALGETQKAIEHYSKAEALYRSLNNKQGEAIVLNQIGETFRLNEDYPSAENYFRRSYELFNSIDPQRAMTAIVVQGIAESLVPQGNYNEALNYYNEALKIFKEIEYKKGIAEIQILMGEMYIAKKEYETSIRILQSSLETAQLISVVGEIIQANRLLGSALLNIDSYKAKEHLTRALLLAQEHNFRNEEGYIHKELSSYYKMQGDSSQALFHFEKYHSIKEELFTANSERALSNIQILHDVEKYKYEIEANNKKIMLLEGEISKKNKELAEVAIRIFEKEEFIVLLETGLQNIINSMPEQKDNKIKELLKTLRAKSGLEKDKSEFGRQFIEVNEDYIKGLIAINPTITQQEIRICALLRLSMSSKEIAELLNVSIRSVDNHRLRIRKKLGLSNHDNINKYLMKIN